MCLAQVERLTYFVFSNDVPPFKNSFSCIKLAVYMLHVREDQMKEGAILLFVQRFT